VMVLLDARGNASRSADAERIRRWIDPNAPPPPRPQLGARSGMKSKAKPERTGKRVRKTFSRAAVTPQAA